MKHIILGVIFVLVGTCTASAVDWSVMDGQVTNVRHGKHANFYTVTSDAGVDYVANSAHAHVGQNESLFQANARILIPRL